MHFPGEHVSCSANAGAAAERFFILKWLQFYLEFIDYKALLLFRAVERSLLQA